MSLKLPKSVRMMDVFLNLLSVTKCQFISFFVRLFYNFMLMIFMYLILLLCSYIP